MFHGSVKMEIAEARLAGRRSTCRKYTPHVILIEGDKSMIASLIMSWIVAYLATTIVAFFRIQFLCAPLLKLDQNALP